MLQRVHVRQGFSPYSEIASFAPASCSSGTMLSMSGTASFSLSRTERGQLPRMGDLVSIERLDGSYPFVGFVSHVADHEREPVISYDLKDHAGYLYSKAFNSLAQEAVRLTADRHLRNAFEYADLKGTPPTMTILDADLGGPVVEYQPRAEPLADLLTNMAQATGWEWSFRYQMNEDNLAATLLWREQIGDDLRAFVTLGNRQMQDVEYVEDDAGYAASTLIVGGVGAIEDRPLATAVRETSRSRGGERLSLTAALMTQRTIIDLAVSNDEGLASMARNLLVRPQIAESLSFGLVESETDIRLGVGDWIRINATRAGQGRLVDREARVHGLQVENGSGVIGVVVELLESGLPGSTVGWELGT